MTPTMPFLMFPFNSMEAHRVQVAPSHPAAFAASQLQVAPPPSLVASTAKPKAQGSRLPRWTDTEDKRLKKIVAQLFDADKENHSLSCGDGDTTPMSSSNKVNAIDWGEVAMRHGNNRQGAECMKRFNKLTGKSSRDKTGATKGPWTEEEDNKITTLVKKNGARKWSAIAAELPGALVTPICLEPCTKSLSHFFFLLYLLQVESESNVERGGTIISIPTSTRILGPKKKIESSSNATERWGTDGRKWQRNSLDELTTQSRTIGTRQSSRKSQNTFKPRTNEARI